MKQNPTPPEATTPTAKQPATEKEDSTPDAPAADVVAAEKRDEPLDERIMSALGAASDKKALDMVALDLREVASFTDYFLIASGANTRQVQAIADEIAERLKSRGSRAARIEGYKAAEWVLLDYGDFIVHIFEDKARRFYDLERLWRDAARVTLPPALTGGEANAR